MRHSISQRRLYIAMEWEQVANLSLARENKRLEYSGDSFLCK